jgi:small conductance mechanosensitive channel
VNALIDLRPAVALAVAAGAFILAALVVWSGRRLLRRSLTALDVAAPDSREAVQTRARQLLRGVKLLAYGTAALASTLFVLSSYVPLPDLKPHDLVASYRDVLGWFRSDGIRILVVIVGAYITVRAIHLWIEYVEYHLTSDADGAAGLERRRRARTLSGTLARVMTVAVAFGAGLTILMQLGINVLPILTGAGIAGLAIGFGAQNLVRDVISGFFLILEDQVRVGDLAQIQSVTGLVEQINLRTIALRDADGAVHVFPNGTITTLANLSKDFAYAVVDFIVPLADDLEQVRRVLAEVGAQMEADPAVGAMILAPLETLGFESLTETTGTLRVRVKTLPLRQFAVARDLRWRVVTEFNRRGMRL